MLSEVILLKHGSLLRKKREEDMKKKHNNKYNVRYAELIRRFNFSRAIEFRELDHDDSGFQYNRDKIVIASYSELCKDKAHIATLLAEAKLLDIDPLLVEVELTYGKTTVVLDEIYFTLFKALCAPLVHAWTTKLLWRAAPEIYQGLVQDIKTYADFTDISTDTDTGTLFKWTLFAPGANQTALETYLGLYENPENKVRLETTINDGVDPCWLTYINLIQSYSRMEPEVSLYLTLPLVVKAPYHVWLGQLENGKGRCYLMEMITPPEKIVLPKYMPGNDYVQALISALPENPLPDPQTYLS